MRKLIRELVVLAMLLIAAIILFKTVFYRSNLVVIVRSVASLFWLFVVPGYAVMYYWKNKLILPERIAIGTVAALALMSILSYYLGLFGLHVKYHPIAIPVLIILLGVLLESKKLDFILSRKKHRSNDK